MHKNGVVNRSIALPIYEGSIFIGITGLLVNAVGAEDVRTSTYVRVEDINAFSHSDIELQGDAMDFCKLVIRDASTIDPINERPVSCILSDTLPCIERG